MEYNYLIDLHNTLVVINLELQKSSKPGFELVQRYTNLQKQFKVKSSFLSGYQLKQLRDVNIYYIVLINIFSLENAKFISKFQHLLLDKI